MDKARNTVPLIDSAAKRAEEIVVPLITRADELAQPSIERMRPYVEPKIEQMQGIVTPYVNKGVETYGVLRGESVKKVEQVKEFKEAKTMQIKEYTDAKKTQIMEFGEPKVSKIKGIVEPTVSKIKDLVQPKVAKIKDFIANMLASPLSNIEAFLEKHVPLPEEAQNGDGARDHTSTASVSSSAKVNQSLIAIWSMLWTLVWMLVGKLKCILLSVSKTSNRPVDEGTSQKAPEGLMDAPQEEHAPQEEQSTAIGDVAEAKEEQDPPSPKHELQYPSPMAYTGSIDGSSPGSVKELKTRYERSIDGSSPGTEHFEEEEEQSSVYVTGTVAEDLEDNQKDEFHEALHSSEDEGEEEESGVSLDSGEEN